MAKWAKLLPLFLLLVVFAGVSQGDPLGSEPQPAYYTTLYSDATYQTQVGYIYPTCHPYYGVLYHLVGTYSYYGVDEYVGTCLDGEMQPL